MNDPSEASLRKYLTEGERIVVATHRHWFAVSEPLATATLSLLLTGVAFVAGAPAGLVQGLLVAWLVVFGRAVLRIWEWNLEWFVATDQRLLLIYGFIIRKVDMLPMSKVTDMTFRRSIMGRVFGYGTFVLESAGQDQALSDLHFIPDPNETYLDIVATIFKTGPDEEDGEDLPLDDHIDELRDGHSGHDGHSKSPHRGVHDEWDEWEDDPTGRPTLRADLAKLSRRRRPDERAPREHDDDPDTLGFSMGAVAEGNPVADHERRRRRGGREDDYAETLYSSLGSVQADPWDEGDHGPHRKRRRRWWGT